MRGYGQIWRHPRIQIVTFDHDVENKAEIMTDGAHIVLQASSDVNVERTGRGGGTCIHPT